MSILIESMEMPKSCEDCPLENCDENYYGDESNHRCSLICKGYTSNNRYEKRRDDCPLVPVPAHGRLIDADALAEYVCQQSDWLSETAIHTFCGTLRKAPTIIPAEPLNEEVNE